MSVLRPVEVFRNRLFSGNLGSEKDCPTCLIHGREAASTRVIESIRWVHVCAGEAAWVFLIAAFVKVSVVKKGNRHQRSILFKATPLYVVYLLSCGWTTVGQKPNESHCFGSVSSSPLYYSTSTNDDNRLLSASMFAG